ncbi:hypothetical protein LO762_04405 [Actinocorallia sp. API 0066]|nr:hypothetical protein [Actinocorallia sp. API 0066]
MRELEELVKEAGPGRLPERVRVGWGPAVTELLGVWDARMGAAERAARVEREAEVAALARRLWWIGGVGSGVVLVLLVVAVRVGRGLVRDGEEARNVVVEAGEREKRLKEGVGRLFLNLAWRAQTLLHRQEQALDAVESRVQDGEARDELRGLGRLTGRMRRYTEGLVVLSGTAPARAWSRPVPVADVLREAVAAVEDGERVKLVCAARVALAGVAVADVVHLVAELVENGTAYAPPPTEVLVTGEQVAEGFAVEVVDRGVGLSEAELAALNRRLREAPEPDLAASDRLGLFVVARLAVRHGIRVTLRPSPFGGVSAFALVPSGLVVPEEPGWDAAARGSGEGSA